MSEFKHVYGDRLVLSSVEEEYEGVIVPTPTFKQAHVLGLVKVLGDKAEASGVKVNDIVLYQTNGFIAQQAHYNFGGSDYFILMTTDMIASVTPTVRPDGKMATIITLENFHILGEWLLVEPFVEKSNSVIVIPENAQPEESVRFRLIQKGPKVDLDVQPSDVLIVDRARANPIGIGTGKYAYVQKQFVYGVLQEA